MSDQAHPAWPSPTRGLQPDLFQHGRLDELLWSRWNNLPRASSRGLYFSTPAILPSRKPGTLSIGWENGNATPTPTPGPVLKLPNPTPYPHPYP